MCLSKNKGGLGFRHLWYFNLAMLGKQGSRFISNPESLPVHILKAKYFHKEDLLNANKVSNPSFVWKSVLQAKGNLNQGTRWRVGDEAS